MKKKKIIKKGVIHRLKEYDVDEDDDWEKLPTIT